MTPHATRTRLGDLPRPQQAGILCNDPQFQAFAGARGAAPAPLNTSACAELVRLECGVNSRADLATNPAAAARFDALRTDFDAWRGRIGTPRG